MRRGTRRAVVSGGVLATLVAAGPASASLVSIAGHNSGSQIQISGGPGEANFIEVTKSGAAYVITDGAGVTPGPGCSGGGTTVTCPDPTGSVVRVVANTADGFDSLVLSAPIPGVLTGGPDDDRITGGPLADRVLGVGGDDLLDGGDGADRIQAGVGRDSLVGGPGTDRLFGEQGTDRLRARDGQRDVVGGGPGRDRAIADRKDRVKNDVERVVL